MKPLLTVETKTPFDAAIEALRKPINDAHQAGDAITAALLQDAMHELYMKHTAYLEENYRCFA